MIKTIIRSAILDDAPIIARNNELMAIETENRYLDPETVARGVEMLLKNPERGLYLIAESDGIPVGQCMITYEWSDWRCGDFWWIQSVYVKPGFRRRGIFSSLFRFIMKMAGESDRVVGIRLYVEKENFPAQETYSRLGLNQAPYFMFESDFTRKYEE